MPDKIKDAFEAVKDTEIFIDENDFRNQLKSDPKAVFDLFNETEGTQGLFLDYKDFEIQLDLKKKEGGGLPFQKTTANAPQFFGEPSVPTSVETLESQSKLTPPQKGGVGKLDLSKGVPVKPLSGDMPIGQLKVEKDLQRIQQSVPKVGRETMYKNAIKSNENKARLAEEKMLQIQPLLQEVDNIQQAGGEVPQELVNQYNNALPTYNALLEQRNKSIDNIEYFNNALEGNRRLTASYTDSGFKSRFLNQGLDSFGSLVMNSIAGTSRLLKQTLPPHLAVQAEIARNISQREGDKLKARAEYTTALMDEKDNYLNKEIDDIYKEQGLVGATEYALKKFTESLPVTLGIMAASATGTGGAVLANTALFGGSANQRYEELKDRTDMTEEQKIANAVGYGSADVLFEGVLSSGMGAVYKQMIKTMGKEAAEKAIKKNVIDLVTNGVKKYMPLSGAVVEGVGEGATQLTQNIVDKYTDPTKKDINVMDGVGNAAAIGFAGGGAMSAPTVLTYVNRSNNVEKNKEIEKKREAIQTELAKPISESTKEILQQTDNELMQEQNELVVEDMKDLTEKLPEEQKEEVKVLAEERRQIENALAETESEEVKTALENKTKQIGEQIDNIYDRAKEPIIGRTDVTQEGLGVATETGTQGVTREGVPSEEVEVEVVEAFGDDAKDLEDFYYESKRNGTNKEFVDEYESMFPPKETQQKIEKEKSNEIEKESNNKIISGEADPIVSKIVSEHTFTDEDNNLIDNERGNLDRESFINKKIKEIISGSKLVSDKIKKVLAPIVDKLKKIIIGISIVSSVGIGKQVSSYQPINKIISEKISSDIANVVKMPYSDIANIGTNAMQKFLEIGDYADTESTLGLETSVDMTGVKESNVPSIVEKDVIIGEATETTKDSKYKIKPYIVNLLSDSVKIKLADNKFKKNRKPFKDLKNSLGIMGSTNGTILFKDASDYQKSLGIQMVYDEKASKIVPKMNSDVAPNDIVFLTSEDIAIPIEDLDMKPNNNGGFDIKKGKDNENGTAILLKKDGNSFHIGWAAKADEAPSFVSTEKAKEFKILRGGMVWLYSTDGEVAVAVSGSLNDIFSEYKRLQEKNPNKKFILFRGDTGSYSTPAFTETNETTADDVSKYSTRNTYGNNVHLVLMKPDAPLDKGLPVGEMGLSPLLALALLKRKKGLSITKEEQDLIDNREKQKQYKIQKEYATQEIKQPKGVRTEPEGGIKGGETKTPSVSDSVQRAKESEKEKVAEGGVTAPTAEPTETEITQTAQKAGVTPKNLRDLYKINRELFGLDRIKSLASAIAMDRMVGAMAKRAGVTKEQMYGRLKFEKDTEANVLKADNALFQGMVDGKPVTLRNMDVEVVNGFYSPIEKNVKEYGKDKIKAKDWLNVVGKGDEAVFTGVRAFLEGKDPNAMVSKQDILDYMKDNRISVVEVVKGSKYVTNYSIENEPPSKFNATRNDLLGALMAAESIDNPRFEQYLENKYGNGKELLKWLRENTTEKGSYLKEEDTKFGEYQLEGEKENYKEVLVTLPSSQLKSINEYNDARDELDAFERSINIPTEEDRLRYSELSEKVKELEGNLPKNAFIQQGRAYIGKQPFRSTHFDELDILVHLRMNTRMGTWEVKKGDKFIDGNGNLVVATENTTQSGKVLFLEEVQSDWGQTGKKEGFAEATPESIIKAVSDYNKIVNEKKELLRQAADYVASGKLSELQNKVDEINSRLEDAKSKLPNNAVVDFDSEFADIPVRKSIPTAPFVMDTNAWTKLGLKVALKEAVKQGADKIAWTTGEQQNDRYDLSKQVDYIDYWRNENGTYGFSLPVEFTKPSELTASELENYLGKEVAKKIIDNSEPKIITEETLLTKSVAEGYIEQGKDVYYEIDGVKKGKINSLEQINNLKFEYRGRVEFIGEVKTKEYPKENKPNRLQGEDLKVGGKGMKGFYGSIEEGTKGIVGGVAEKVFGQKVGETDIIQQKGDVWEDNKGNWNVTTVDAQGNENTTKFSDKRGAESYANLNKFTVSQPSIDVTPALRAEVERGLALFQRQQGQQAKGAMVAADGAFVIYALTDPNVSTPLHEMAHVFEHYLNDAERVAVQNWAGTKAWTTQTSEAFARGFEKYLAEGKAPTPALQKIFEKFKQWLTDIYNGIKGSEIDIELNDQMREIYAKMLGAEAVTPTKAERKAIASAKIDEIANALKDILPKIEGEKLGVGQDEIIDVIAKAVKALVNTGIEIDEAIKQVKARLSEAFDGVEGISDTDIKDRMKVTERLTPKSREEQNQKAQSYGFKNASHALNSVNKETGETYETFESIPDSVLEEVGKEKAKPETPKGKRRFTQQFIKQYPELAEMLSEDIVNYAKMPNNISVDMANAFIEEVGLEEARAAFADMSSGLPSGARMTLGQLVIKKLEEAGRVDEAIDVLEQVTTRATEMGQEIQALSMWAFLTPQGQLRYAQKTVNKAVERRKKQDKSKTDKLKEKLKKANQEAVDETLQDPKVRGLIEKTDSIIPKGLPTPETKKPKKYIVSDDRVAFLKKQIKGKLFSGIPTELIELGVAYVERGAYKFSDFSRAMIKEFGNKIKPYLKEVYTKATETLIKEDYDKSNFDSADNIDKQVAQQKADEVVEKVEKAIKAGNKKALAQAIANLQKVAKQNGLWGQYKKYAVSRLKQLTIQNISDDVKKNPPLDEFTKGLVQNIKSMMMEKAEPKEREKIAKRPAIEVIADAFKNPEAYKEVLEETQKEMRKKYKDDVESLEMLDEYFGEFFDKPFSSKLVGTAIKEAMKEMNITISDIVTSHYTVYDATKKSLVDKLVEQAGLSESEASVLAKAIEKEFDKIATEKKQKLLEKILSNKKRKTPEAKSLEQELIRLTNLGAFSDSDVMSKWAEKMGYPKLTQEQVKEIQKLADAVQRAGKGFERFRAIEDLLSYQANLKGVSQLDVAISIWYANILSGFTTQTINTVANLLNAATLYANAVAQNPKNAKFIASGFIEGFKRGLIEAKETLRTGYSPIRGKVEVPPVLERVKFEGFSKPLEYAKFIGRLMKAADVLVFEALKEMRAYQLAAKQAAKTSALEPSQSIKDKAAEILGKSDYIIEEATETAELWYENKVEEINESNLSKEEKEKALNQAKIDKQRKLYEYLEEQRSPEFQSEVADYAARGTYNYKPEGILGWMASAINQAKDKLNIAAEDATNPFQQAAINTAKVFTNAIVPFTNIIANVANESLNYTPVGIARRVSGTTALSYNKKELTDQQKVDLMTKAVIGNSLMVAIYLLATLPAGDDDEPLIEITANGTGDYRKNYELQADGWMPYSVRIGKKRISYQYTPFMIPLSFIGNIKDYEKYRGEKLTDMAFGNQVAVAFGHTFRTLLDMTALSSLNKFLSASLDPRNENKVEDLLKASERTATSVVVPNLFTQSAKYIESAFQIPLKETSDQRFGNVLQHIPYVRNKYYDKLNALGEPIMPDTDKFLSTSKDEPIWGLIANKKAFIGKPSIKQMKRIDAETGQERFYTQEEYYNYGAIRGALIKEAIIKDFDKINAMSDKDAQEYIGSIKNEANMIARLAAESGKDEQSRSKIIETTKKSLEKDKAEKAKSEERKKKEEAKMSPQQIKYMNELDAISSKAGKIQYIINLKEKSGTTWYNVKKDIRKVISNDLIKDLKDLEKEGAIPKLGIAIKEKFD